MSVEELLKLRDGVGKALGQKAAELEAQLSKLGGERAGRRGRRSAMKGRKVAVKYRDKEGNTWAGRGAQPVWLHERLPALAAELVHRPVDAIFATGSVVSAIAAKSATATIPIVFANGSDPVQYGLVASLNRPGGNVTGISFINGQLGPKRIQLLRLLNPKTAIIAVLVNPKNPNAADAKLFDAAGRSLGIDIAIITAGTEPELKEAFKRALEVRADALLVHVDALFNDAGGESQIVGLAAQHRLPTMMASGSFTAKGGLISYGPNVPDLNRQAGVYIARILRGEKPGELPVVQPTSFPLRVNLKTAKALGLSIPESFLLLADEVIE
jgi:putative ABC transport system substrate-binding protein